MLATNKPTVNKFMIMIMIVIMIMIMELIKVGLKVESLKHFCVIFLLFLSNLNTSEAEFMKIPFLQNVRKEIREVVSSLTLML